MHNPTESNKNVEILANDISKDWYQTILVDRRPHTVKVDTGAQANVMALSSVRKIIPNAKLLPTDITLSAYGGTPLPVVGLIKVKCSPINNIKLTTDIEFVIVNIQVKTVLGLDSCLKMRYVNPKNENIIVNRTNSRPSDPKTNPCFRKEDTSRSIPGLKAGQVNTVSPDQGIDSIISEFSDLFDNSSVGCIEGYEYDIKIRSDSVPVISKSRPTPFATLPNVNDELDRMTKLDIITPVDEPTEWVNCYTTVQKGDKTRICLDPNALNKCILREHTHLPTTDEIFSQIQGSKYFSKVDLKDGYWQVKLTYKASLLTTFHTHRGRFRFKRLPFGLSSANEVFQKRICQIFDNLDGVIVLYDDVIVFGSTKEEHNRRLRAALQQSRSSGIRLNKGKCKFMMKEVKYVGHIISSDGIKVDPDKVADVLTMPEPTDKKGVQRILGTLNFLSRYIPNMSTITQPIRELLGKHVPFIWTKTHQASFDNIKKVLTNAPVLGYYDVKKPVVLEADASSHGLGACILQNDKPIAYASRSLTKTQVHYAQIEKELLSIVFGCERFRQYIYAKHVVVHTDHKPLITALNKPLLDNPKRIQRLLLRLQCYSLTLQYVPGKYLNIPDMLSRAHAVENKQSESEQKLSKEAEYQVLVVINNMKCSDDMWAKIKQETCNDLQLQKVKSYILSGWPGSVKDCDNLAKLYWPHRAELALYNGFLLFRERIVIPTVLRAELLDRVHVGHQGRERCKRLARGSIFWPGMNKSIDLMVDQCASCLMRRNNPARESLKPHTIPNRAWQKIGIDLFSYGGQKFQIVCDYFSKWIETKNVQSNAVTDDVINHLLELFCRFGYPEEIFSDGDPLYTSSKFDKFCKKYEIDHTFSSARYPQSNGQIERSVQHVKNILAKSIDSGSNFDEALLMYRNTPLSPNIGSPAMLFFNRSLRTTIPNMKLANDSDFSNRRLLESRQLKGTLQHDSKIKSNDRNTLQNEDLVKYRDSLADKIWKSGKILSSKTPNRSYQLVNSRGNIISRNNRLLIPDKVSKKLDVEYDCLPSGYVSNMTKVQNAPSPEQKSQVPLPAVSTLPPAPCRRSERTRRKPDFYGNPQSH